MFRHVPNWRITERLELRIMRRWGGRWNYCGEISVTGSSCSPYGGEVRKHG